MSDIVEVLIPVQREAAAALDVPRRREEIGRRVSEILSRELRVSSLMEDMRQLQRDAHANGLTDEIVDAELAAWRAERSLRQE